MKRKEDEPGKGLARAALARGARVLLSLVPLLGADCGRSTRAAPPSPVVVISVDTLRADHLPVYGYRGVQTPSIDAIARDSTIFDNAYSNVPLTLPSHAALLTGLLPFENGVRDNIGFRLAPERQSLASLLRAASYATGAAVSSYVLRADRGLAAGFDSYDDSMPETPTRERPGLESAAALAKWAENVRGRPLFLFLHIYEPHTPYKPPEPFASRYASAPYDGEIAAADAAVGSFVEFLKRAGLYDRAILVFLSDHGEGLGDHGEEEHGVFLYREALRVPLLLKRPGSAGAGKRISAPVSLTDIVPTVLSLLSLPVPERPARRRVDVASRRRPGSRSPDLLGDPLSAPRPGMERSGLARRRALPLHPCSAAGAVRPCRRSGREETTWPPGCPPPSARCAPRSKR